MRYRLATYRECKAHREWNTTCPDCGRRGKFSPYIDTTTMRPVDDRQCGRCNRLSNCGYHLPPRMLARTEDFGSRRSREKRESPGPVNYASHRSHKSHRSCIAEGSQLPSGWIKQQAALLGEAEASFVATDAHSRRRRSRQQGRSDLPFREIREICVRQKEEFGETKAETAMPVLLPHGGGWEGAGAGAGAAIVESEKTALIMSLVCPDKVWLATGGKANFKEQMLAPLIGLEVAVYPDADALRDWYTRAVEMNRTLGTRLHIPTWYYNLMDHPEAIARGLDLADVVMGL